MAAKKNPAACDGRAKAVSKIDGASNSATAFQSQIRFLARRGIPAARAAIVAPLVFGETAR